MGNTNKLSAEDLNSVFNNIESERRNARELVPDIEACQEEIECPMCEGELGWTNLFNGIHETCQACHGEGVVRFSPITIHDPELPGVVIIDSANL